MTLDEAIHCVSAGHIVLSHDACAALGRLGARMCQAATDDQQRQEGWWLLALSIGWHGTVLIGPTRVPRSLASDPEAA